MCYGGLIGGRREGFVVIVITAGLANQYDESQSRYGTPEKRDAQIILTETEAQANDAKQEVSSGKSFASVAKKDSIDPVSRNSGGGVGASAQCGGRYGPVRIGRCGGRGRVRDMGGVAERVSRGWADRRVEL